MALWFYVTMCVGVYVCVCVCNFVYAGFVLSLTENNDGC